MAERPFSDIAYNHYLSEERLTGSDVRNAERVSCRHDPCVLVVTAPTWSGWRPRGRPVGGFHLHRYCPSFHDGPGI